VRSVDFQATRIRIAFTRPLNAATVHYGTVLLTRIDDVPVENYVVSVSPVNPRAVVIELSVNTLDDVLYQLSINSDVTVSMLDLAGQPVKPYRMEFR